MFIAMCVIRCESNLCPNERKRTNISTVSRHYLSVDVSWTCQHVARSERNGSDAQLEDPRCELKIRAPNESFVEYLSSTGRIIKGESRRIKFQTSA